MLYPFSFSVFYLIIFYKISTTVDAARRPAVLMACQFRFLIANQPTLSTEHSSVSRYYSLIRWNQVTRVTRFRLRSEPVIKHLEPQLVLQSACPKYGK